MIWRFILLWLLVLAAGISNTFNPVIGGANYGFGSQADGSLIFASNPTGGGLYTYNTAGLLASRQVGNRITTYAARDGEGRPLIITNTINAVARLTETLDYSGDGLLLNDTLARQDFTDNRVYNYALLSRRLTQEQLNLNASTTWVNDYVYDRGVTGGPGALTTAGPTNATFGLWWSGLPDAFSRVNTETNNAVGFLAYGFVNGQSTLSAWLDNQPIQILDVGTNMMQWRTFLELSQGTHQLKASALHPSGFYTSWATNVFTNNITNQITFDTFDGGGNITNRVFRNASGATNRTQALSYDAKNRLRQVIELNTNNYGFIFSAIYDGLDRRIATITTLVSNGVPSAVPPQVLSSYFDPQVQFLELGVSLNSAPQVEFLEAGTSPSVQTSWKLYGPDLNGKYGGLNGTGGLEGVSPYQNTFNPVISDARGNVLAEETNGVLSWTLARTTAYGAVPGYRAVAYGNGVDLMASSVYRGHEVDVSGTYHFGLRDYDATSQQWLQHDPSIDERNLNGHSYCGGDPENSTDASGLMGKAIGPDPLAQFQEQTEDYLQSHYGVAPGTDASQESGGQAFSSMVDMIPVIGGLKMWYELGTGFDSVTGQHIDSSDWAQVAMIGLSFVPVAAEAAPEEVVIESQVNIPFYGVGQIGAEGTANSFQYALLKADYAAAQSSSAFAYYMRQAQTLDVSSAQSGAVFYSGLGNRMRAEQFAIANGGTTLEMTRGGAWLDQQNLYNTAQSGLTTGQADQVWATMSQRFAQGASGNAVGFVNGASAGGMFNTVEYPALVKNPNVVNVITGGH